jgi:GT2 family glycosyltransferase
LVAQRPTVSVCIANYNGADVIVPCLKSVFDQHAHADIEVIVHDDASSDNSLAIISAQFPKVKLIASADNVGFCIANNKMVEHATGDFVLLLNNDAWLGEGAISAFLDATGRWGDCIFTLTQYGAADEQLLDCGMYMDVFANAVPIAVPREQPVAMVMGACLWVSKKVWHSCGGLPVWFESMAEDMYLCNYARLQGVEVVALTGAEYFHHVGHSFGGGKVVASGLKTTVKRRRLSERNKLYVLYLFYPLPLLCLMLPLQVVSLFFEGLILAAIKRDFTLFTRVYGHALWALWANFATLRRERAAIQGRRTIGLRAFLSVYRWMPYKLQMLFRHGFPELR